LTKSPNQTITNEDLAWSLDTLIKIVLLLPYIIFTRLLEPVIMTVYEYTLEPRIEFFQARYPQISKAACALVIIPAQLLRMVAYIFELLGLWRYPEAIDSRGNRVIAKILGQELPENFKRNN
jgi:hypothetical protein